MAELFWPAVLSMGAFYLATFAVGVGAARRGRRSDGERSLAELMLAGRSLPPWIALCTMTATWVGGGYINGTAERSFSDGVFWGAQAGVGYALSLMIGGLVFARSMRRRGFTTLIDPFERRYGARVAAILMLPAVLAELFWSGAILVALGSTLGVILGLELPVAIVGSAAIGIAYTALGGLRAVAYTDVLQRALIVVGLGVAIPFVLGEAGGLAAVWAAGTASASLSPLEALSYADWSLLLILGGIPWNVYFQRVLACRDERAAVRTSVLAGGICVVAAVPPLLLGLAAMQIDWNSLGPEPGGLAAQLDESPALVLPFLLRYGVPVWVAVLGLGSIAAAVMSSIDSSMLSAATLLTWNGYRKGIRPRAGPTELRRVLRVAIVILGTAATWIAFEVSSVAALWYLCGDLVYCVLFPQLSLALFDRRANWIGALAGLGVSVLLRLGGGDATLGLESFLPYPDWDGAFPFRTLAMLAGLASAWGISRATARRAPPQSLDG